MRPISSRLSPEGPTFFPHLPSCIPSFLTPGPDVLQCSILSSWRWLPGPRVYSCFLCSSKLWTLPPHVEGGKGEARSFSLGVSFLEYREGSEMATASCSLSDTSSQGTHQHSDEFLSFHPSFRSHPPFSFSGVLTINSPYSLIYKTSPSF